MLKKFNCKTKSKRPGFSAFYHGTAEGKRPPTLILWENATGVGEDFPWLIESQLSAAAPPKVVIPGQRRHWGKFPNIQGQEVIGSKW